LSGSASTCVPSQGLATTTCPGEPSV
jgi:hypothetical protein